MATVERETTISPELEPAPVKHPEFLRAAEIIRQRGWCQMFFQNERGAVCVMGALKLAFGIPNDWKSPLTVEYAVARSHLADSLGVNFICDWNDKVDRTEEEAIEALERAAIGG